VAGSVELGIRNPRRCRGLGSPTYNEGASGSELRRSFMPARSFSSSVLRRGIYPVFAMLAVTPWCAHAAHHRAVRMAPFARAEQLRDALESKPEPTRTRAEYERVLDAYRVIYHRNPADAKAPSAVNMVAGLLAEEGRVFHHEKSSENAIGQFEFLRAQYPGSPYHQAALLAEATIYLHDLHDRGSAKSAFQKFLADYPDSPLTPQAKAGLKEARHKPRRGENDEQTYTQNSGSNSGPNSGPNSVRHEGVADSENVPATGAYIDSGIGSSARSARTPSAPQPVFSDTPGMAPRSTAPSAVARTNGVPAGAASSSGTPPARTRTRVGTQRGSAYENELTRLEGNAQAASPSMAPAPGPATTPQPAPATARTSADSAEGKPLLTGAVRAAAQQHHGRLPLVTNVRHWSTPVYTRVAIDLQDQVEYEAARVPNPDRIYFDLHGAKIAPELIGKTVNVTDDGFLQRIRVAQFSNDVTRIVLDVSQVSEYSAFFLPNPWRLIIDIHGRRPGVGSQQIASTPAAPPAAAPVLRQPEPGMTAQQTSRQATAQATRQANQELRDIAALGAHADQVKATARPTMGPIAANVGKRPVATRVVEDGDDEGPVDTPPDLPRAKQQRPSAAKTTTDDALAAPRATRDETASSGAASEEDEDATPPRSTSGPSSTSREARSTVDGQRSLTRALGLKIGRIVVDAGHGGHDSGTLGPGGIQEKDVVLDVALRLGKLLHQRMGAEVTYTRDDDTFVPLEQRTAIANKAQADLFISVHANSSSDPTARGVETYYLNFTTSPDALEVAARENAVSDQSVHELSGLVKKITLKDKIDESREFAADVEDALYTGLERDNAGMRDRGVKKAPFVVLIGANMPSILAEISFLTNPNDATQLRRGEYRQRIAESLYRGVAKYVSGLSGLRVAQNTHAPGD
jgi:N-acetylmuramoyl-L-alanine amidase